MNHVAETSSDGQTGNALGEIVVFSYSVSLTAYQICVI